MQQRGVARTRSAGSTTGPQSRRKGLCDQSPGHLPGAMSVRYNSAMTWLSAVGVIGLLAGWCVAQFASGPVGTALSVVVLALTIGGWSVGHFRRPVPDRADG